MKPETKAKYPKHWQSISRGIKTLIGHCERCGKSPPEVPWLTVYHIDGDPSNNDPKNHYVCCPKCHFDIQRAGYPDPRKSQKIEQLDLFN